MVRFSDSTKFVFMLFVCMLVSVCLSFSFCLFMQNKANKTPEIIVMQDSVEIKQVEYKAGEIPNGVASKTTIENSLNSSVSISALSQNSISSGSGTIIGSDNSGNYYVVTCHHVVEGAFSDGIQLTFNDGSKKYATFVGSDPQTDVAVLKFEGTNQVVSEVISNNDQVFAGENIYVIGNSLGLYGFSVTTGCLSQQQERQITIEDFGTFDVLQTDSAVNHGVSGGGLFDTHGTLVGMISCGYDNTVAQNINFVLPIYKVMEVVQDLLENKDSATGYGYVPGRYNIDLYIATWGNSPSYAIVTDVPTNSSFYGTDKATSLQKYDLIKTIQIGDGIFQTVSSSSALIQIISDAKDHGDIDVNKTITLKVCENSGINDIERTVTITIKQYVYAL